MIRKRIKPLSLLITAGAAAAMFASPAAAQVEEEVTDRGVYYEDDAWYDISEWFDGNDYNPTDETWWRWDNETYERAHDTGGDSDNDRWFGFDDDSEDDDDWFYDYYDDGNQSYDDRNNDGVYEYTYWYWDRDRDGAYDSSYSSYDRDGDGRFDNTDYYDFGNENRQNQNRQDRQDRDNRSTDRDADNNYNDNAWHNDSHRENIQKMSPASSKAFHVQGEVSNVKKVNVRGTQHYVVKVDRNDGDAVIVDLGPVDNLSWMNPKKAMQLDAKGPAARVGDKTVVLAKAVKTNGRTAEIDRNTRTLEGTVKDTRTATVRGTTHQMAVVETSDSKHVLVDLGPTSQFDQEIKMGDKVSVRGTFIKTGDKRVVMGEKVTCNGRTASIDRRSERYSDARNDR